MIDFYDILAGVGLVMLGAGLWLAFQPSLAAIVVGAALFLLGVGGAIAQTRVRDK